MGNHDGALYGSTCGGSIRRIRETVTGLGTVLPVDVHLEVNLTQITRSRCSGHTGAISARDRVRILELKGDSTLRRTNFLATVLRRRDPFTAQHLHFDTSLIVTGNESNELKRLISNQCVQNN